MGYSICFSLRWRNQQHFYSLSIRFCWMEFEHNGFCMAPNDLAIYLQFKMIHGKMSMRWLRYAVNMVPLFLRSKNVSLDKFFGWMQLLALWKIHKIKCRNRLNIIFNEHFVLKPTSWEAHWTWTLNIIINIKRL